MQPLTLSRAVRESFREVLATPGLRGPNLMTSIAKAGLRHGVEPFRACLSLFSTTPRDESEAIRTLEAIEAHREELSGRLLRDPGFAVAAADVLHAAEGLEWSRSPQPGAERPAVASGGDSFDDLLARELRRHSRTCRPMALVVLGPRDPSEAARQAGYAVMRSAVRDVDHAAQVLPEGIAVILPCTTRQEGVRAAHRYLARLGEGGAVDWCAGVAGVPGLPHDPAALAQAARTALAGALAEGPGRAREARREQRRSARRAVSGALDATLVTSEGERRTEVLDLAPGGALVQVEAHLPCGQAVTLAIAEVSARPRRARLGARVVRSENETAPTTCRYRVALEFEPGSPALPVVADILAWLPTARAGARPA